MLDLSKRTAQDCTISTTKSPNLDLDPLAAFEPRVRDYFSASFPAPTPVQQASWPLIAKGDHVLITAPTGSGKTLTAFLWALNKFASGELAPGVTSVLYVSPLKALNNDIQRNLLAPLETLAATGACPNISVQTRSGDTPQNERQRMLRHPPEILITTPESLSLILTSVRGRQMLSHIDTIILDEVHSVVSSRRGVQLLCALERLCWMGLRPQRIALSATVKPLTKIAEYVAGYSAPGIRRPIKIVQAEQQKSISFQVKLPDGALQVAARGQKIWEPLTDAFRERIQANNSTLFFTNSRRLAEKITLKLNQQSRAPLAYAHHGSLARDIRHTVEQKLKSGDLRAIVATSSLEMGIDIGSLDEVVLIQSPPSVSASLQRIGRSGHNVGETSVGTLFPTHAHDFLEAAALSRAIEARDIEPLPLLENPLDLLAQLVIATTASEDWDVDELYTMLTRAAPYAQLRRDHYTSVIEMLAGRYAGMRIRDLRARITFDRLNNRIRATKGAVMAYYSSGGTIPDRGYFKLRHASSGQVIGELDEEFVWEATLGQTFNLGTGHWQIQRITHNDVLVNPAPTHVMAPPFWRSESVNRDYHFSSYIASVLDEAERSLLEQRGDALAENLMTQRGFDEPSACALKEYLERQREHSGPLPGRHRIVLELINTGPAGYRSSGAERQLVIHTFWGARVNRPWGTALGNAWHRRFGEPPELQADNDAIIIQLTRDIEPAELMGWVTPDNLTANLRNALEGSAFFGARFRECSGRALLLTRKKFNQRLPLWMTRLQSKKLLAAIKVLDDFPILLEAWRTCLEDEFDLPNLQKLLGEIQDGDIQWRIVTSNSPSPFAANLSWNQVNQYMYADDTPEAQGRSNLSDSLIDSAFADQPSVTRDVINEFLAKRQRRLPGYVPEDDNEWLEWIKERVMLQAPEVPEHIIDHPLVVQLQDQQRSWIAHLEQAHAIARAYALDIKMAADADKDLILPDDDRDITLFTQEILSFYGPLTQDELNALLPEAALAELHTAQYLIRGQLVRDEPSIAYCDAENFEILLRFQRRSSRPAVDPLPVTHWPGWTAHWQNVGAASAEDALRCLRGYCAPVTLWLQELLPTRLAPKEPLHDSAEAATTELNRAYSQQDMGWVGTARDRICIDYAEELARHRPIESRSGNASDASDSNNPGLKKSLVQRFADPNARYPFTALVDAGPDGADQVNDELWKTVWQGQVSSDSLDSLISAQRAAYKLSGHSASRRARRVSWPGSWLLIQADQQEQDPLVELESAKDVARTLLERYGVLCRELAHRELASGSWGKYRWRELFAALRVMELSGEVLSGAFFDGLGGPQFAAPVAVRSFTEHWSARDAWLSALDPISPSGMGLDWGEYSLPHRRQGNHFAMVAGQLALFSENNGSRLTFLQPPDTPATQKACSLLQHLCRSVPRISLQEINTVSARKSPYLKVLEQHFELQGDHKGLYIERASH